MKRKERLMAASRSMQQPSENKSSKQRSTPVRRCLLAALDEATEPMTAADILYSLEQAGLSSNKTTVYRQLDALVGQGILTRLDLGDGKKRYELSKGDRAHPHVVCTQCGSVTCLPEDAHWKSYVKDLEQTSGFDIEGCSVELYGVCGLCKQEEA